MPDTEAEVIAVLPALPAIDGRHPNFDAEFPATSYEPDEQKDWVGIGALPVGAEPLESIAPDMREAESDTIEATVLDPEQCGCHLTRSPPGLRTRSLTSPSDMEHSPVRENRQIGRFS